MMKTVLVTGGTTRLGLAIANGLRARGWRVFTSSHRADAGADFTSDLTKTGGAGELLSACRAANGGRLPDALVNNAALFIGPDEMLRQVNLEAPVQLMRLMALRREGTGAVVNILDTRILGRSSACFADDTYSLTKAELRDATLAAARQFTDTLRVNAVAPGPVLVPTEVHESAGAVPLGRPTPAAVAGAVAFLLEAEYTTGAIIPVDGGQSTLGSAVDSADSVGSLELNLINYT